MKFIIRKQTNIMNDDLLFEIFKWLPLPSLLKASLTCIQFNNVASDDYLWHGFCERDYPGDLNYIMERVIWRHIKRAIN